MARGIVNKRGSYLGEDMRFLDYDNAVRLAAANQTFEKDGVISCSSGSGNEILINDIMVGASNGHAQTILPLKSGQRVRVSFFDYTYFIPFLD